MNLSEGLARLAKAIRWFVYLVCGALVIGGVVVVFTGEPQQRENAGILWLGALFFGVPGLALAWIIDGFAKPSGGTPRQP